ncbi:MAG: EsV-1-83 [Candidatus Nomurabacteria bacterium GW2011_GWA1_40_8]|nr:MAG: EsV-1-83 [Candidatus Nomurabacteria bacterium GW2011_GWA1_40_8]
MKKKIGILGYGEIGRAIGKFYKDFQVDDLLRPCFFTKLDILHVCIPYSSNFVRIVKEKIKKTGAKLTIIHSTVAIGTTQKIGGFVVHSPVRGVHPNLHEGIKTFVKYVGFDDEKVGLLAFRHLRSLGIKAHSVWDSRNTEALKLWDTTQYGVMIILNKEIKKFCDKHGLDFSVVYKHANRTYNEGYVELGRSEVVRPFLQFMAGKIGGHCVLSNCEILPDPLAKWILLKKY